MEKAAGKEIKKKNAFCAPNCVCQTEGGEPYCKITGTVNNSIFFTASRHPDGCSRQHGFGSSYICMCPVRQEIYRTKNI